MPFQRKSFALPFYGRDLSEAAHLAAAREGLSIMTNVYISSPRNAVLFCLYRAQKVAAWRVSTVPARKSSARFAQITFRCTLDSCAKARAPQTIHGSPYKTYKHWAPS